ncbi:MAG: GTPase Era [Bdellovibrionia bacterium]
MAYRAGFLGIIGQPNAGKSTLMNYLVKEKVSIVTAKPQTTRRRIMGIWSNEAGQIVFVDAPGLIEAEKGLNGFLAKEAADVIQNSDAILAVVSVDEAKAEDAEKTIEMVSKSGKPWMGIITKTDITEKAHRVLILKNMIESKGAKALSMSVKKLKDNAEEREALLIECLEMLPETPAPLYDVELFTNESVKDMTTEIIREKCFENLHQEIPFNLAIRIIKFDEFADPCPKIYAEILVPKENHRAIVIGKGGEVIKKIGSESRKEIEKIMDQKVFLDLQVVVRDNWFDNTGIMKELKYVVDNK